MRSFHSLSLLLCGYMSTVALSLSLKLQPPPDRSAQSHLRTSPKVFYHDSTLARRSTGSSNARAARSVAGIGSARFTTFASGPPGACGATFTDNDFVVALSEDEFDEANHCHETITISYDGKSTQAQIVDLCTGCPPGGLDLTYGLFSYFAPASLGVLYGEWSYGSVQPSPTPTTDPNTTTTKQYPTSTSSSPTSQSSSPPSRSDTEAAASAPQAVPSTDPQVVNQLNIAIFGCGGTDEC